MIRWIGPTEGSAQDVLVQNEERWAHGSPTLAICQLDGTCLGKIWLSVSGTDRTTGSIGYWLLPVGRGRGLATSAVRLLSTWAVREFGITNLRIRIAPHNKRSQRVAERSGFRRMRTAPGESPDGSDNRDVVFELDKPPSKDREPR